MDTEIAILQAVDHPNVVKLFEVYETEKEIQLVIQLIRGGELLDKLVELQHYSEADASRCVRHLLLGLKALHKKGIVHRDLKVSRGYITTKRISRN